MRIPTTNKKIATLFLAIFVGTFVTGCDDSNSPIGKEIAARQKQRPMKVTPLLAAVGAGDVEQVRSLLEHGANPDDPAAGRSPLIQAITLRSGRVLRCDLPIVQLLLKYGANPNRPDPGMDAIPIHEAFAIGDIECARAIRDAGARADSRDEGGQTILNFAVDAASRSGDMSIIDTALSWGIDKNDRTIDGNTVLHEAVLIQGANVNVFQALLDRGVDPCIKNRNREKALDMAVYLKRDQKIIDLLDHATHCSRKN